MTCSTFLSAEMFLSINNFKDMHLGVLYFVKVPMVLADRIHFKTK